MDDNPIFPEPPAPATPSRRTTKRTVALVASALVLCTAGGAVGGLALESALHSGSTSANNTTASPSLGYPPGLGNRRTFGLPSTGSGAQQSASNETTSTASSKQVVGLVRIQSTLGYQDGAAVGTGMILTSDGEVVTNHHVIQGATNVVVTVISTGKQYQATVVGSDASDDITVLKLTGASGLATVPTSASAVSVGQKVTAVGDAQGASEFTASPGTVSAINQTISPSDGAQSETLTGVIQYAADVMSGDSGGATYDAAGQVVGMTTAASTGGAQTNGYAIPIAKVLSVASDLESHASAAKYSYGQPAFIGVGVNQSAVVEQVYAGTPAAASGLIAGDRIVAVGGTTVSDAAQLQTATRTYQVGQTVRLTWTTSAGQRESATVRLMAGPAA